MSGRRDPSLHWEWLFNPTSVAVSGFTPLAPFDWLKAAVGWTPSPITSRNYAQLAFVVFNDGPGSVTVIPQGSEDAATPAYDSPAPILLPSGSSVTVVTDDPKPFDFWRLSVDLPAGPTSIRWGIKGLRW